MPHDAGKLFLGRAGVGDGRCKKLTQIVKAHLFGKPKRRPTFFPAVVNEVRLLASVFGNGQRLATCSRTDFEKSQSRRSARSPASVFVTFFLTYDRDSSRTVALSMLRSPILYTFPSLLIAETGSADRSPHVKAYASEGRKPALTIKQQ